MTADATPEPAVGWAVRDRNGNRLGTVDAVFADYLLVRTAGLLPVDLYVPVTELRPARRADTVAVTATSREDAYDRWHRPLKRAPHE